MADRWEAGEIVHTSEEPNSQNQNLNQYQDKHIQTHPKNFETGAAENELEFRTSQIEKLEEEQAVYAQPPQPLECNDGMPTTIPDNMNYPTQYGRSSNVTPPTQYLQPIARQTQTTTSVTCYRTEYKTLPNNGADMQPSINIPITCRCVCRQRKSKSRGRKRREPSNSSSRLNSDSSLGVRKTTSFRFCDEDYFSADSDSDLERRGGCGRKLAAKKARSNIRKRKVESSVSVVQLATMSPEQCMMLKVMEQMMTILCRMDAAQRRQHHVEDSSVKTLYQSSRTGEESKSEIVHSDQNILGEDDDNRSRATVAPSVLAAGYDGDLEEQRSSRAAPQELCEETPEDVMMPYEAGGNQNPPNNGGNGGDLPADGMIVSNSLPILVITFDPETCMPCCCVHKGPLPGPCQSIPVFEIKSCNNVTTTTNQQQPYDKDVAEGEETEDSCIVPGPPCTCDECTCTTDDTEARFEVRIHDHTHIMREDGTECGEISEEGIVEITMNGQAELSRFEEECITDEEMRYQTVVCEATQTEECCCYSLAQKPVPKVPRRSVVSMDELQEFCEEIWSHGEDSASPESCPSHSTRKSSKCKTTKSSKQKSNRISKSKRSSGKSVTGAAAECDCCHCRAEREAKQRQAQQQQQQQQLVQQTPGEVAVLDAEDCKNQLKSIVDSIITDLECMEKVRRRMNEQRNEEIVPKSPPQHARQSFPVTILEVCELGLSSLYVKWVIHDCFGIGGYEIYVDGYLTNRYYNARHEAAVVCDIDVTQAHKVCLVAKPKAEKALLGAGDLLDDDCRPPVTPPTWSPSVFLYEPSPEMDYCKRFR